MELTKQNISDSFINGVDCSQIIMGEWADNLGLSKDDALKVSSAFGGGMGIGESCGAIIGAMLVLGMKYGNTGENQQEQKDILNISTNKSIFFSLLIFHPDSGFT